MCLRSKRDLFYVHKRVLHNSLYAIEIRPRSYSRCMDVLQIRIVDYDETATTVQTAINEFMDSRGGFGPNKARIIHGGTATDMAADVPRNATYEDILPDHLRAPPGIGPLRLCPCTRSLLVSIRHSRHRSTYTDSTHASLLALPWLSCLTCATSPIAYAPFVTRSTTPFHLLHYDRAVCCSAP